jgi:hypothetical protein
MNLVTWLQGKKTYIVALIATLDGIYQYYVQHGNSRQALVTYLLFGGGLAALRAAISKVTSK